MKKSILTVLIIAMLFCFAGCEKEKNSSESAQTDLVSKYYGYAQSCISENDTEKAKEVLKEGIEKTKSSVLSDLLSEIDKTDSKAESTVSYEYGKVAGLDFSYWSNSDFVNSSNSAAGITLWEVNDIYVSFSLGVDNGSEYMYQQEIDLRDCQAKWQGHYNDGIATYTLRDLTLTFTFNKDGTLNISESGTSPFSTSVSGLYKRY